MKYSFVLFSVCLISVQLEAAWKNTNKEAIKQISSEDIHGQKQGKVTSHFPGNHPIVTAEFLYWQANEDHLSYGSLVKNVATLTDTESQSSVNEQNLHFDWNPGFRIGLGYQFAETDNWDLLLDYTYMKSRAHAAKSGDGALGFVIYPSWDTVYLGILALKAKAKWKVNYNVLDAEVGKNHFIGTRLSARPFLGLRGAMIHQRYSASYQSWFTGQISKFEANNEFDGVGIRAGGDFLWHFIKNFGLCGQLSGALLHGRFNVKQKSDGFVPTFQGDATEVRLKTTTHNFWKTVATLQAAIGLSWEIFFTENKRRFSLSLMYEINEWFKQNQFKVMQNEVLSSSSPGEDPVPLFRGISTDGDLGFQGATLRAEFDF